MKSNTRRDSETDIDSSENIDSSEIQFSELSGYPYFASDDAGDDAATEASSAPLSVVEKSAKTAFDRLTPIRCFNYNTQLCVAARLISETLQTGSTSLLILDKNAEDALDTLEGMGFTLRQAVLDRQVDIYYYRRGVRDRTFFKKDYEDIFGEFLKQRLAPVNKVAMVEFDTLFGNSVNDAVSNQIEDFCDVARGYDVDVWGLYSPPSWSQDDFLSDRLPESLGQGRIKQAKMTDDPGSINLSVRPTSKYRA